MEGEQVKSIFKSVCVFCGSSSGKKDCYREAAIELGKKLVAKKLNLVYGGGSIGLMGLVAETVHNGGGYVLGIIPKPLAGKERTGESVGEVKFVDDMHQRKAEMSSNADCFIALPGGYGTMEELLEVITWAQLGIHTKPVGLLNVDGYYNDLLSFIDKAVDDGFIQPSERDIFVFDQNAHVLIQKLEGYVPVKDQASNLNWKQTEVAVAPSPPSPGSVAAAQHVKDELQPNNLNLEAEVPPVAFTTALHQAEISL